MRTTIMDEYAYCKFRMGRKPPIAIAKTVALMLSLAVCVGPAEAEIRNAGGFGRSPKGGWVVVAETDGMTTYMYPSTIHAQGRLAHMWSLINYKLLQTNSALSVSFMSEKSECEYDCEKAKWRTLSSALHSHQMGNGPTVYSKSESEQWQSVAPNSAAEILWKVACEKIMPRGKGQ